MKLIELTQGQFAKVSDHRFEYLNQWGWFAVWSNKTKSFYAIRNEGKRPFRKHVYMHRAIMNTPNGMICDHKDHDTLNNQDENLRNVTNSQNSMNRRINSRNYLGEKNISRDHSSFKVQIEKEGFIFCKTFPTLESAIVARDEAVKKYHGEFAYIPEKE